ncbi:GntR family transcriptional regulator [Streptomyces zhihengii]|uniref:GntR family transcriptional regulator n=1 Tax=Streptomyces zhihengii TaxID=1818004 RepID=A0ABS2UXJ0_9ACTN|nr:GntR family transcriptional regulator [Streptomyces zhihengii]MBM9622241.1 GntR family transcriptional regulator [Streptomyces zhihengii]
MSGYAEIAAHYRDAIVNGDLSPGDSMPSYAAVAEEHDANRTTVIRAFDVLRSEGLIVTKPSKGSVVATPPVAVTGAGRVDRIRRNGQQYARGEVSSGHRTVRRSIDDPEVCQALDLEPGDECVIRIRVFERDGKPTSVGLSVYPPRTTAVVPELSEEAQMNGFFGGLYTERTGREVVAGQRTVGARQASQNELNDLAIDAPPHAAVAVLVERVTYHDEGGPLAYWEDVHAPGSRIAITPAK